jgi:hypothetical protein
MRDCGDCTACCDGWLSHEQLGMYPGNACEHRGSGGCAIYKTRPQEPCRTFECAWLQDAETFPQQMRPDQCGAIVLQGGLWREWRIIRAVAVGTNIPEETLEWLRLYTKAQDIPLIFSERELIEGKYHEKGPRAYGSPSFAQAIQAAMERGEKMEETEIMSSDIIKF